MTFAFRNVFLTLLSCAAALACAPKYVTAQTAQDQSEIDEKKKAETEAREAIDTLGNLLAARKEQTEAVEDLKKELEAAKEDASKKELEAKIAEAQQKVTQTEAQLSAISTGVADDSFSSRQGEPFDLQSEFLGLAEPFVKMMRAATATAREIESLRATKTEADRQIELSRKALHRINQLRGAMATGEQSSREDQVAHLTAQQEEWRKRLQGSEDLAETADQQLQIRLKEQATAPSGIGQFATEFLRSRGLNLILAMFAFFGVFTLFRLAARAIGLLLQRNGIERSLPVRVGGLIYKVITIFISLFAMLYVLNMMNDWILLGITSVFAIAIAWIGLKMLPAIIEQTTLLLNLGAVQESERVLLNGVPWRVDKLDFYTDLVNPDLEGGTFTLPVRELVGLHSRPAAQDEAWFPTRKGDWAQLADGHTGKVVIQTPELVQIVELGGSRVTYSIADFIANTPRNLSTGYRVEVKFGIDYRHQAEATDEIPRKLCEHVKSGLETLLDGEGVRHVQVELAEAGDSSINYEVEADIAGDKAHRYEDIEREMTRLLVEACNVNSWTIPFPQMVLHRST